MQTNRLEYIDRLKGFAILCVVLGHYAILVLKQIDIVGEIIGSFHIYHSDDILGSGWNLVCGIWK